MSSDSQDQSIPAQRDELTKHAKSYGYTIVHEYVDSAISGDATERRDAFLQMRDDAAGGGFDCILAWDQDRFGRFDVLDAGYWIYPFRQAGVRLETICQGRIDWEDLVGQLVYSIHQVGKAQYLRDLSQNTVRGQLAAAKAGRAGTGGKAPYGYRSRGSVVEIIENEAETVRWIFDEYLKPGSSVRAIACQLNERKIPGPRAPKKWKQETVRGILGRRKYCGTFVYGERSSGKYFSGRQGEMIPRRKTDPISLSDPVVIPDAFAAIIDQDTFDQVQRKLDSRRKNTRPKKAHCYPLGGLLRCGDCGGTLGGNRPGRKRLPHYMCRTYLQGGSSACWHNTVKEAPLLDCITAKIKEEYCSPEARARLREAIKAEQQRSATPQADAARLRKQIEALDVKIEQGTERVFDAPQELVPSLYKKLEAFKSDRERLKAELQALTARKTRSDEDQALELERAMAALDSLETVFEKAEPAEVQELLHSLISRIELHFEHGTRGKYKTSRFSHGKVLLRPSSSHLASTWPSACQVRTLHFSRRDLEKAA